jgi:hypothetical protein
MTLALDRIISIQDSTSKYVPPQGFNITEFFQDVIGVTVNQESTPEKVVLFADNETAPYIVTKPLHHTQKIEETLPNGMIFSIAVQLNFELEREILGFGDRIKVIAPERLKRRIKEQFENALDLYQYELSHSSLQNILKKVEYKGFAILNSVFGRKEINLMRGTIHNYQKENPYEEPHAIRNLFGKIPALQKIVFNSNLLTIIGRINQNLFLTKAIYFDKSPDTNWYVTWHQDATINVKAKVDVEGFSGWTTKEGFYGVCPPEEVLRKTITIRIHLDDTNDQNGALKVVPGSHNKKLSDSEIQLITKNSIPFVCDVEMCGIHIMKPLLLHASSKATSQKQRRVLHLEFNTMELPEGLDWAEKQMVF